MLCDECGKREAEFSSRCNVGGKYLERHLCSECFHKTGSIFGGLFGAFMAPWNIDGFMSEFSGAFAPHAAVRGKSVCPKCGTTEDEFLKSGFVGCADCYKEFAPIITPVIKKLQGDTVHVGKVPEGVENTVSEAYAKLSDELESAKKRNDYVAAQEIYDRMKALKGGNK